MSVRERIASLRREVAQLESSVVEDERQAAYLEALRVERAGVEEKIRVARALGDKREKLYWPWGTTSGEVWVDAEKTGDEVAEEFEQRLVCIDREIARVTS